MKTITEAEAQQLANLLGMWIAADKDGSVYAYKNRPHIDKPIWNPYRADNPCIELQIHIVSDRQWTKQIWKPESV